MTYLSQLSEFREKVKSSGKAGPTITVSGYSGTGKTTVAKHAAESLGIKFMSAGKVFRRWANEKGMDLEEFCETRTEKDDLKVDEAMMEEGFKGNVVLDGRLTGWVMGDDAELKVWISCPLEIRARIVAEREGWDYDRAYDELRRRDEADVEAYRKAYGVELEENIYDMIIENVFDSAEELQSESLAHIKSMLAEKAPLE